MLSRDVFLTHAFRRYPNPVSARDAFTRQFDQDAAVAFGNWKTDVHSLILQNIPVDNDLLPAVFRIDSDDHIGRARTECDLCASQVHDGDLQLCVRTNQAPLIRHDRMSLSASARQSIFLDTIVLPTRTRAFDYFAEKGTTSKKARYHHRMHQNAALGNGAEGRPRLGRPYCSDGLRRKLARSAVLILSQVSRPSRTIRIGTSAPAGPLSHSLR